MGRVIITLIGAGVIAVALLLAVPRYQIVVGESQAIAWRVNMRTGELAVCTSPDLPAAGCKAIPGSSTDHQLRLTSEPPTGSPRR